METLPSSVTTIKLPNFNSTPRELHHLKTTPTVSHPPPQTPYRHLASTTKTTTSTSTKSISSLHRNSNHPSLYPSLPHPQPTKPTHATHQRAASGYAAALLDIAQCDGTLAAVQGDARKLSRLLRNRQLQAFMNDKFVGASEKGEVIKQVVRKTASFNRHLVGLVNMLVQKGKVETVAEVLYEFERIYAELSGTSRVVVVPPLKVEKMEVELFRSAVVAES